MRMLGWTAETYLIERRYNEGIRKGMNSKKDQTEVVLTSWHNQINNE